MNTFRKNITEDEKRKYKNSGPRGGKGYTCHLFDYIRENLLLIVVVLLVVCMFVVGCNFWGDKKGIITLDDKDYLYTDFSRLSDTSGDFYARY